ncbi:MAG TPA: EfeM/EfeO family lipoprotein, partial [Acidimicrobiales bacterium]|nr:EfeM/EfeO family lipoprotein [Acidimicrobiales bacterium]
TGPAVSGAHPYVPLGAKALAAATAAYRRAVSGPAKGLVTGAVSLCQAVQAGRTSLARQAWLSAQLDFDRMGGAPSLFGTLSGQIDETPLGLQGGAASPYFVGLRRLEYGLWAAQPRAELLPVCAQLVPAVRELSAELPRLVFPPRVLGLAALTQLEQIYELGFTGQLDEGSHTELASAWAQVLAAQSAVSAVSVAGAPTGPSATTVSDALGALRSLAKHLLAFRSASGHWAALSSLDQQQREVLDSQFADALDALALVPAVVEGQDLPEALPAGTTSTATSTTTSTTTAVTAAIAARHSGAVPQAGEAR